MPHTLKIGSIRCHILSDGTHLIDGGGFFGVVPRVMWQRVIQPNADNMVPSDDRSLLIESDAGLILVDVGYGDKLSAKARSRLGIGSASERLLGQLSQVGYTADDIDIVLLTHYHGDHVGGATRWAESDRPMNEIVPTFPNARYLGQRIDLAEASFPNERTSATYHSENWQPLLQAGKLDIVDGPQRLATGVRTDIGPGHTASLQIVWVEDGGESLLFLGDAANWAVHLERLAWVPSFDIFPMTSIETKRRIRSEALERNALLVFQHDPCVITGRLEPSDGRIQVRPELTQNPWPNETRQSVE
jgi:glyoxylase-like metal-dependent hydrolase (beta-lactamase superfamily II)